jgi:riboflavin synthase
MFTGLVSAVGVVREVRQDENGLELTLTASFDQVMQGESIAIDGACLTVIDHGREWFRVHVVRSSLDRTGFSEYRSGRRVNLERALRVGDRLGGHLVQGHVDGIGTIERVTTREDARLLDLTVPDDIADVSMPLGSITLDGVSLTVNAIPRSGLVQVSLIPHTLEHTALSDRKVGDRVHLEGDIIGKYVRHLLRGR